MDTPNRLDRLREAILPADVKESRWLMMDGQEYIVQPDGDHGWTVTSGGLAWYVPKVPGVVDADAWSRRTMVKLDQQGG